MRAEEVAAYTIERWPRSAEAESFGVRMSFRPDHAFQALEVVASAPNAFAVLMIGVTELEDSPINSLARVERHMDDFLDGLWGRILAL